SSEVGHPGRRSCPTRRSSDLDGAAAADRLLAAHGAIDVFCASDLLAIGVALSYRSAGLQLGQDVQLIGYDDIDLVAESHLSLSRSEEHTSELQSRENLVCRIL